ncbi:MAG: 4-alpha-glucanotransferase [Candidatus Verstraetearchaeota archaeon]|nr:4-alpha-glucanotransferase [Candidatus Verstraetearchaeota archaeon]
MSLALPKGERASGVLLHPTSLPSQYGIGDFGPQSRNLVDLLAEGGMKYWQVLPLNPTSPACGNSPYLSSSGFAISPLFISPEILVSWGLLDDCDLNALMVPEADRINYGTVHSLKSKALEKAYSNFKENRHPPEYEEFCSRSAQWLDDYSLFAALREESGMPWYLWPEDLRKRDTRALEEKRRRLERVDFVKFVQFIAYSQWSELRGYCKKSGIRIFGDLPFYVSHDSADVWANQSLFKLDGLGKPLFVSGVPPDYFSETGQLWGHPVYDWEKLRETGFEWWMRRIEHELELFDLIRIDHFRGLLAYWEVPASENNAVNGRWVATPSEEFFNIMKRQFPTLPFVAEDLGVITHDVKAAMIRLGIPGMKVLIFAFDGDPRNPYLPEHHEENSVSYTGTHDTNTVRGWFKEETNQKIRANLFRYIGREVDERDVSYHMVRLAMGSHSRLCIVPVQDVLNLGSEARLNKPFSHLNNYLWKMHGHLLNKQHFSWFFRIASDTGRASL